MLMNRRIYLVAYYDENILIALYKHFTTLDKSGQMGIFNCILNDSNDDDCLMLTGKLFKP